MTGVLYRDEEYDVVDPQPKNGTILVRHPASTRTLVAPVAACTFLEDK